MRAGSVPTNVPLVTLIPAVHADLTTGEEVFVLATLVRGGISDDQLVVVEKAHVASPM